MEEIWKDVVGYEGKYQVSSLGNVRNKNGTILKPQKRNHGYLSVWLYNGEKRGNGRTGKSFSIHRLVAEAFIPNPTKMEEINHIDECKQNNCVENLEWCTHKENSSHGTRGKRISSANTNGKKSKKVEQYTLDGELIKVFQSLQEADRNGFGAGNIHKCIHGKYSQAYGYKWQYASLA